MPTEHPLLPRAGIRLAQAADDRKHAIDQVGNVLVEIGAVEQPYLEGMHRREKALSTFVGEGVAIPHGTNDSRHYVRRAALAVLQFPEGVDWGGDDVRLCVGIAAAGDEQVGILAALAGVLMDPRNAAELRTAPDADTVIRILLAMEDK